MQHAQQHVTHFEKTMQAELDRQNAEADDVNLDEDENQTDTNQEEQREAAALQADEYLNVLLQDVSADDIRQCFEALDDIEEQRANLVERKKSALMQLEDKGCHKEGIIAAWKRHSKPKKQQEKIDATFARCGKVAGGFQPGLFD